MMGWGLCRICFFGVESVGGGRVGLCEGLDDAALWGDVAGDEMDGERDLEWRVVN
jgi:hypothetical protein